MKPKETAKSPKTMKKQVFLALKTLDVPYEASLRVHQDPTTSWKLAYSPPKTKDPELKVK